MPAMICPWLTWSISTAISLNTKNNAQRLSYDDLLTFKRDFNGYIYAEDNVYGRQIQDYIANARDQMIESDKITDKLRTYESDLWEF